MKVFFPITFALSAALVLGGCTTFMCDTCKSAADYRREVAAYRAFPRLQSAPQRTGAFQVDYISLDFVHMGNGQVQVVAPSGGPNTMDRLNAPFVYYQGPFVNPMPITTVRGAQYFLDFRFDQEGEWGAIYLLDADGQFDSRFPPPKVGEFLP